ncbi:MAG: hypothetical protein ABJV04_19345 [Aliiglaciecola sp.]|uniref:hypothetical protein n=1 Tax=Pseudomonadota TaxID=1224 RepID=UPI003298257A
MDINPSWINEQIRKRQDDGVPVCVKLYIKEGDIDLVLSCGDCGAQGSGGGRAPNPDEERVFALWNEFGCKEQPINPGKINAFINRIK